MKSTANIIGIILIAVGAISLGYGGFTYTSNKSVAEIGNLKITAQENETIPLPPILGGICLVAGVAILIFSKK